MNKVHYYSDLLADDADMGPLVEAFVTDLNASRTQLEAALANNDISAILILAHRYKGSGGGYGFPAVTRAGAELETTARDQVAVTDEVRQAAERFLDIAQRVRAGRPR